MGRYLSYFFWLLIVLVTSYSCRKTSQAPPPGAPPTHTPSPAPPPPPPPPPVKLEETDPPVLKGNTVQISENIRGFYEALPARYDESGETYPVIIDFHGGGQYGNGSTDLPEVLKFGIPKLLQDKKFPPSFTVDNEKFSFIVIAPQLVRSVTNSEILSLLNYIKANYRIDESRMYLSGFSLGGRAAANYAALRPEKFAALLTFGGLVQIDQTLDGKCASMAEAMLPVWHFHNKTDEAWDYSEAVEFIRVLRSKNGPIAPRFTTFEIGQGKSNHDSWTRSVDPSYKENGKNIYEWMLGYKR